MKIRWSIGFKIFFLAAFLVLAIFIVALNSFYRTAAVNNESKEITEYYLPLTQIISRVDEHVLRQELHFARILREFSADSVDIGLAKSDIEDLKAEKIKVEEEISLAISLVEEGLQRSDLEFERDGLEEVKPRALRILKKHQKIYDHNLKVLAALNNDDFDSARTMIERNWEIKGVYNASVDELMRHLQSLTLASSKQADRHEAYVLRFNFFTTLIAAILGVILAFLITRGLVSPIHRLVQGTREVEKGNLDAEVSATSKDEIGSLTNSFNQMLSGLRLKERVQKTFGKYIDPRIVERLILDSDGGKFEGEKRVMTVLFSDLKGFTSISEGLNPAVLVKFINLYLSEVSKPIAKHGGVIDKYIGDAVMAYWGPPFTGEEDQARLACFAALGKISKLKDVRAKLPALLGTEKDLFEVDMRIGISTGEMIVGSIGSEFSKGYTVLGDTVNAASRLEGVNKVYGTRILITESTRAMAGYTMETREIDCIQAVGKEEPIRIYELLGERGRVTPETLDLRDQFEKGLRVYREANWEAAQRCFESCLSIKPEDGASKVFLDRIEHFKNEPPPSDWSGVWRLTQK